MAWLKIYQSIRQHRKILDAADALEIAPPYMIGLLTSFWLWALDNAPDGNVSEISARNIARAAQWDGDADELLQAFISAGLLDQGNEDPATLTIHDWEEYAGTLIQQREAEKERSRRRRAAAKKTEGRPPDDQQTTAGRVDKTRVDKTRDIKDPLSAPPEHEAAAPAKSDPTPYVKIMQLYNEICVSFSKIQKIDGARRKAVAARFKTYQKIMNEAVAELRAEGLHVPGLSDGEQEVVEQMRFIDDAHIDIEVEAALPDAYVSQQAERLKLYRELDSTKDEEALQAFESRLADRFGPLPRAAKELLNVVRLRWEAIRLGMERVKVKNGLMIVHFVGEENSPFYKSEAFMTLLQRVTQRPDRFVLKQHNNRLAMTVRNVKDVEDAYKTLQQL